MSLMRSWWIAGLLAGCLSAAGPASAQNPIIYPNEGQSAEQIEQDKFHCYGWARDQSGFDPLQRQQASSAPPPRQAPKGGVGRGAVRGGVGGAAVGAIAGDAGKGAAAGAVGGAVIGGARRRDQRRQQQAATQQWAQQEVAQYEQARSTYDRAYAACLEGRGYTVK